LSGIAPYGKTAQLKSYRFSECSKLTFWHIKKEFLIETIYKFVPFGTHPIFTKEKI